MTSEFYVQIRDTIVSVKRAVLVLALLLAGCAAEPVERPLRSTHHDGFWIQDDGSLTDAELGKLEAELSSSRAKILAYLGQNAMPADFRSAAERTNVACPVSMPPEVRVAVVSGPKGRCHADETGVTIIKAHLDRKDATHELTHYLAGGSWRPIDEGFAVYMTEKLHGPAAGVPLDTRARAYIDLGMEQGLDRERLRAGMSRCDYDVAGSFVKWLIAERGLDAFMALYHGESGDYHGVYGVPEAELFAKWRESIKALNVRQDGPYYRFKDFLTHP